MTNGEHVIEVASRYLGVRESAPNRGELVDRWAARWNLRGVPWCGIYADAMYAEAGVDDAGLCHPSVAEICRRARAAGAVWDGRSPIPPAALWCACGIHVALINAPLGGGVYSTIEGNHGDAVSAGERHVRDGLIVIPPAIREVVVPARTFWLEDTKAQPRLYGPWREKDWRDRKLDEIPKARRARARLVNHRDQRQYAWIEGPRRLYGPWGSQDARDAAREALEHRLGHPMRAFSKEVADGA